MDISVVVPLYNEAESLPELHAWIERVMNEHHFSYEIIFVNDGSTDHSWQVIEHLARQSAHVKGIKFRRNYGKSPALHCGFQRAEGDVIITMDADLQDSPDEIPELYRMIKEDGYDIVSGWKKKRYDNKLTKNLPSKLFNATARKFSGINLHDFNCGLKSYRREVVKNIEVYNDMHRYIPYLAKIAGFNKIGEKVVHHQARKYGETKFGLDRFVNGYLDLISDLKRGKHGDEHHLVSIVKTPEAKKPNGVQVMFIIDTTGSMGDELAFLQKDFSKIAEDVGTDGVTYSVNFYRDDEDEYVTRCNGFTDDISRVREIIGAEVSEGGGDEPEAVAQILKETITDNDEWSEDAAKVAFMIFDAPPHEGTEDTLKQAIETAARKGIRLVPVVASNSTRDTELFGRAIAITTNGTYVFLTDDSGVGETHLEPIVGDYTVELLHDVIVRIISENR